MNVRKSIDYSTLFERIDTVLAAGLPQMETYREIGRLIAERTEKGAAVAVAEHLQQARPDISGFSARNVRRMREFYIAYQSNPEAMNAAMEIGWTQNVVIIEADLARDERMWSAAFEYYLHYSKPFDREMFSTLPFEDNLGEGKVLRALDFWNNEIAVRGVWQDDRAYANSLPEGLRDIYMDGLFIRFYRKMNKLFPKGGRMREAVKKIAAVFIR